MEHIYNAIRFATATAYNADNETVELTVSADQHDIVAYHLTRAGLTPNGEGSWSKNGSASEMEHFRIVRA